MRTHQNTPKPTKTPFVSTAEPLSPAEAEVVAAVVRTYLDGLGVGSRASITASLDEVAHILGAKDRLGVAWHRLAHADTQRVRAALADRVAKPDDDPDRMRPRTANRHLAALRGALKAAWRGEHMTTDQHERARDVRVFEVSGPLAGRLVSQDEIERLVDEGGGERGVDRRDAAIVATAYAAGLRRFEVGRLRVSDYDRDTGDLTIRQGKRDKKREVRLPPDWRGPLHAWLDEYLPRPEDPLFPSRHPASKRVLRGLSPSGVALIFEGRREDAKVAPCNTHDMRRTLLTNLIASGVDLPVVQRIAGHSSVQTTAGYDRRGREVEQQAMNKIKRPGKSRKK